MKTPMKLVTAALLASVALATPALAQDARALEVGIAKLDITPEPNPEYPAFDEYDHEKLYVRAIVFDNGETRGALIGADISGIDEPVWAEASKLVAEAIDAPIENIIISPTHIHSDRPAGPPPQGVPRYGTDFVAGVIADAAAQAAEELEPALVGYGVGEADLNVSRDAINPETDLWTQAANFEAEVDKTVAVLTFYRPDGAPIAAYANYAMHPVSGYLSGIVSSDFAGTMSTYVENAFGDDMIAIFTQGASGDVNPRWLRTGTNAIASISGVEITGFEMVREDIEAPLRNGDVAFGTIDPEVAHQLSAYMESLGIILGEEVIRVMSHTEDRLDAPRIWSAQSTLTCPGRKRLDDVREGAPGQYEDGPDVDIRLGALGFDDIALATANAEIYGKIGMRVKAESPLSKTMFVTIANGKAASGYIPDDESFGHQTFQVLGSRLKPGCAEQGIAGGLSDLISTFIR